MVPIVDSLFFPPQLKKNKKLEQGQNSTVQIWFISIVIMSMFVVHIVPTKKNRKLLPETKEYRTVW